MGRLGLGFGAGRLKRALQVALQLPHAGFGSRCCEYGVEVGGFGLRTRSPRVFGRQSKLQVSYRDAGRLMLLFE